MIGVYNVSLLLLVDCIEDLEGILDEELIITIYQHHNILLLAVLPDCLIDVGHCCHLDLVSHQSNLPLPSFLTHQIHQQLVGMVSRSIINYHYFIIAVVEVKNRLQVIFISIVLGVVESWDNNTKRELLWVLA